jgi:cell division protein FtsL
MSIEKIHGKFLAVIDIILSVISFLNIFDMVVRILAAIGVVISTYYLIRKYINESRVLKEKKRVLELERMKKEQELAQIIERNIKKKKENEDDYID